MDLTSWQSFLPDSTPLSVINIPGTHDSATQFVKLSPFSRCQNKSIEEQLEMGVRFLDIRLFLSDNRFYAVHGIADCRTSPKRSSPLLTFTETFATCKKFLQKHPAESIVVLLNVGRGDNGEEFFNAFYEQFIEPFLTSWFLENRIPVLGECRGKMVLTRRCGLGKTNKNFTDQNTGINFTKMGDQGSTKSSLPLPCPFEPVGGELAKESAVIQDRYMFNPLAKWGKAAKTALDNAEPNDKTVFIHYLSTAGVPFLPVFSSKYVNFKFKGYKLISKKAYGLIVLDFPTEELITKIVQSNFA